MLQLCPPSGGHRRPRRKLRDVHLCFNDTFQGSSPRSAAPLLSPRWPPMAHRALPQRASSFPPKHVCVGLRCSRELQSTPSSPQTTLGSQKEDPHTRLFVVLPCTVLFKAASLLVLLGGGALNASLPVAMDFPRSFLPCQMPHLGVCEQ